MEYETTPGVPGPVDHKVMQQRVISAEQEVKNKAAELEGARATMKRLERELYEASAAVSKAQEDADAMLPQCRMVSVHLRSGETRDIGRVVILRRTPGGIIVVRGVGDTSNMTYKFKWRKHSAQYVQAEKQSSFSYDSRVLHDVPADYLQEAHAA